MDSYYSMYIIYNHDRLFYLCKHMRTVGKVDVVIYLVPMSQSQLLQRGGLGYVIIASDLLTVQHCMSLAISTQIE